MRLQSPVSLLLLASSLVGQSPGDIHEQIREALDRARPALVYHLGHSGGDPLALVCLAALRHGMDPEKKPLVSALQRLAKTNVRSTYGCALRLMVMASHRASSNGRKTAKRDTRFLLGAQHASGGFGYDSGNRWDLSNTQYAALGLRAAAALGVKVGPKVWRRLLTTVKRAQHDDGSFGYRSNRGSSSSMTVAGIAVLEICRQHLTLSESKAGSIKKRVSRSWQWMAKHKHDIGSLRTGSCFYFHYGLERAAILSDVTAVDGLDWYLAGARMLLEQQTGSGDFFDRAERRGLPGDTPLSPINTAFAILFLSRQFKRQLSGPTTGTSTYSCRTLPEQANGDTIRAAVDYDVERGIKAVPDLLKAMRSRHRIRRTAAAKAMLLVSGQGFGYHPRRDNEANADALKQAELWWLRNRPKPR